MVSPGTEAAQYYNKCEEEGSGTADATQVNQEDTWQWWNAFRCAANFEKKLSIALELSADLPDPEAIDRWLGEPVKCLIVPTHLFTTNKKGFPVLPKTHQMVIRQFLRQKAQILISGALRHQFYKHYQQYIEYLWQVSWEYISYFNHLAIFIYIGRQGKMPIPCWISLKDTKISCSFLCSR